MTRRDATSPQKGLLKVTEQSSAPPGYLVIANLASAHLSFRLEVRI